MDFTSHTSDHDIAGLLSRNVVCHGNRNAIIDGSLSITYQQLDLKAKEISLDLIQQGVAYEDPVGILTAFGLPHLIAQVGVIYAGATCVPLDSERSDTELAAQLHVAHVNFLLVDDMHHDRQLSAEKVVLIRDPNIELLRDKTQDIPKPLLPTFRSHILFTSGTTGMPKGVQIPAAGIVRIARDPLCKAVSGEDTVGYLNNPCFDVSLIDIWCSPINGTTIVVMDRRELLSPGLFARSLKRQQVTFAFLPTALFHMVALACPTAFSDMNTLIVGGEGLSIEPCKAVLEHGPPRRLINGYGPTECTILACGHQITWKDVQDAASGYLPIGRPLWKTVAHVFDDSLRPVTGNNQGELYLGGAGLSMGYLEAPDAQRTGFVTVPGFGPSGEPSRLYRTKDAVCRDDAGNLVWVGRMDREVKMRGYRIPLDVIESEILSTGLVSSAVAAKVNLPDANMSLLVACVTYLPSRGGSYSQRLLAKCQARLPKYMVPQLVEFGAMPMTRHGKIDRKRVHEILVDRLLRRLSEESSIEVMKSDQSMSSEAKLRSLWSQILLTVPRHDIQPETDFFGIGATSLHVASLIHGVHNVFGVDILARTVYECSTLRGLADIIQQERHHRPAYQAKEIQDSLLMDAATLWRNIPIPQVEPVDWLSAGEGRVFLTGATGFIGAFMLLELLRMPQVRRVRCLVRADRLETAYSKLFRNLDKYRLAQLEEDLRAKIEVLPGDFSQARLGLTESSFQELAEWASVVFHLGAQVNYNEPYAATRTANVLGTLNLLRLAATGKPKAFHYASTISAFGPTGLMKNRPSLIDENGSLAPYVENAIPYEMGYGQSQWVADELVSTLMRRGFPTAIYRCGFVLCHGESGIGNVDDFTSRLLTDCTRLGIFPLLPNQREELVTVDYVASAMRLISTSNDNLGRAYHLVPDLDSSIDMNTLFCLVGKAANVTMTGLPYHDWLDRIRTAVENASELRLKPLLPMLEEKVLGERTRIELYEGMARFKRENTVDALQKTGYNGFLREAAVNEKDLQAYVRFLQSQD
ncbi:hypothetical protein MHUMG1_02202 [Metarhizium humberi]|uniref:Carrier domain-containing protein n=1 Tax=Metarhizium humberi TaxID=2596975 RepID=A0A9P8MET0_9HYPO|nr:hypothetical protein MHUMG1_02202 [Metarhizium humberi]